MTQTPSHHSTALNMLYAPAERSERYSLPRIVVMSLLTFGCMLPVTMLVPALKELVADRHSASPFWTHSFMSFNMLGAILAGPLMGLLADGRFPRRRIASIALCVDGILLGAMAYAPNLISLLTIRFLEGAAHILALSMLMAIASGWSDPERRGRTMGIVGAFMMFGTACGTRLGGLVWLNMPTWTFQIAGGLAVFLALLTLVLVVEPAHFAKREGNRVGIVSLIRQRPALGIAYAYAFVDRFCVGVVITTFGLFLADVHGLSPELRSRMLLWFLLPFSLLVFPAGLLVDRIGRVWPIVLGNIGFGILFASYGLVPLSGLPLIMILSGVLSAIMFAPNLTLCADLAPPEQRGASFTGFNIAGSMGFLMGPLVAGAVFSGIARLASSDKAYDMTFGMAGGIVVLCGVVTLPWLLKLRREGITR